MKQNLKQQDNKPEQDKDPNRRFPRDPEFEKNTDRLVQGMMANLERKRQAWLAENPQSDESNPGAS